MEATTTHPVRMTTAQYDENQRPAWPPCIEGIDWRIANYRELSKPTNTNYVTKRYVQYLCHVCMLYITRP